MKYHVNLSLDYALYTEVQNVAKGKNRTVSSIVEEMLRLWLEKQ